METVLQEAERIINGQLRQDCGDARRSFDRVAAIWSGYLGSEISGLDVVNMMTLLKVARAAPDLSPKEDAWEHRPFCAPEEDLDEEGQHELAQHLIYMAGRPEGLKAKTAAVQIFNTDKPTKAQIAKVYRQLKGLADAGKLTKIGGRRARGDAGIYFAH